MIPALLFLHFLFLAVGIGVVIGVRQGTYSQNLCRRDSTVVGEIKEEVGVAL